MYVQFSSSKNSPINHENLIKYTNDNKTLETSTPSSMTHQNSQKMHPSRCKEKICTVNNNSKEEKPSLIVLILFEYQNTSVSSRNTQNSRQLARKTFTNGIAVKNQNTLSQNTQQPPLLQYSSQVYNQNPKSSACAMTAGVSNPLLLSATWKRFNNEQVDEIKSPPILCYQGSHTPGSSSTSKKFK